VSIRGVRWVLAGFFVVYLLVMTWPLGIFFGRAEPFVLGLPFSFFWPALWIVLGGVVLALLDRSEERGREGRSRQEASDPGSEPGSLDADSPGRAH
jgi:hypothetical protein